MTTSTPPDDGIDGALDPARSLHERTYMHELGQRVRTLREERGLTQHALAQAAGIATDMISRLENGHYSSPGLRTLLRIAAGMGTSIAALLPEHVSAPTTIEQSARARLLATLARASPSDVELVANLASVVVGRRSQPPGSS